MPSTKQVLVAITGLGLTISGLSLISPPAQANPAGTGLVISEVYGGGGNGGAVLKNDFIELYNPTDDPISVDGWSVQYRSSGGTSVGSNITPLSGVVAPHSHYLIQEAQGAGGTDDLPTPDATGTIAMAGGSGQVLLVDSTTASTVGTGDLAGHPDLVDMVGYGTAGSFEGQATTAVLDSTTSAFRDELGTDTDHNNNDFSEGTPNPENSESDGDPGALNVVSPGNKSATIDEAIAPFTVVATGGTPPYTFAADGLPTGVTIDENTGEVSGIPGETCTCEVTVTVTDDEDATDDVTFTFTVSPPPEVVPIHEVQGEGDTSPMVDDEVTIEGVVTALYKTGGFNGMYVQTAGTGGATDATPNASDAIFVFGGSSGSTSGIPNTPGAPNIPATIEIGDSVQVTGVVSEFAGTTEITPASTDDVVELGTPLDPVTGLEIAYPTTEEGREAQEGMLLAPTDTFTVTNTFQTNQWAEIGLATGDLPLIQPTEVAEPDDEAGIQAVVDDNAARAVTLDDASTINYLQNQTTKALPLPWLTGTASPPRVGAEATFNEPVILEYRNNVWKFQPRQQVTDDGSSVVTFEDTRATNLTPADVGGDITIATFNVLNFFNTTGEAYVAAGPLQDPPLKTECTYYTDRQSNRIGNNRCGVENLDDPDTPQDESNTNDGRGPRGAATDLSLARQLAKLVHTINEMDATIVGLEEMENSIKLPGETNRDDALAYLVDALNAAEPGKWKYVKSPGEALTAGAIAEQDVIRGAFIYQPALVKPVGKSDILFGTDQFANAREPLAQAFKAAGAPNSDAFGVIVNHFKSKGDNQSPVPPATGDNANDEFVGAFNGDRIRQAERLVQFAEDFAAARDIEAIFLAGDFNSYSKEEPIQVLEAAGFERIESTDDPDEESYSFSGLSGSLDHVLGNAAAMEMVTGADIWEINANEAIAYQYSRYNYNATIFFDDSDPFATSDHNPEIVGLDLPNFTPSTNKQIQVLGTNDFHGRLLPDGGNAAGAAPFATAVNELRSENPNTIFTAAGDLIGASTFESFVQDDKPTIDALNAMDLEVSSVGNHEFDKGYDDLVERVMAPYHPDDNPLGGAEWEYIGANLDEDVENIAPSYTTTFDGVQIGFVGAVTEDLPQLVSPDNLDGVTVTDIVDSVNAEAADLRADGAEIVVLLVHEGSPTTDCLSSSFTDEATVFGNIVQNISADVDAIISGHTHLAYNCRFTVDEWVDDSRAVTRRPVVSAGQYGTNLNQLVFNIDSDTNELVEIEQDIIATAGVGYEADPTVDAIVDAAKAYADDVGDDVLGTMDGPFNRASYNSSAGATENRGGESTLGNLVAEVQRWATQLPGQGIEADIAFMNPGGLRADMAGVANGGLRDLTRRGAANVQPFANTLVNMELTGAQIETVLEQQWQRTPTGNVPSRPFLRLGVSEGFTYTYVETPVTLNPPNQAPVNTFEGEITGMWLNGEPIDPEATYSVTVNSFLATGGDNFHELAFGTNRVDTGKVDLEAMVDFMEGFDELDPLAVDYAQRAVGIEFPDGAPDAYQPGDTVEFDVSSWAMTAPGDLVDTELQVVLDGDVLTSTPVNNTVGNKPYDNYGTASVSVDLPNDLEDGTVQLMLVGPTTGTEIPVEIEVDSTVEVQILGTNDFHGRLIVDGAPTGSDCSTVACPAALLAGAVKEMRGENPNTVFAAAGDLIGASTFESFIQKDKPTIDALNEATLDVSATGNHEFDQGYDDLVERVMAPYHPDDNPFGGAEWEYIAANVDEPGGADNIAPTWTQEFGDIKVGFVGAVTEELPSLVSPTGIAGLTVNDIVDSTNAAAADLKADGADLVVLLVHEGSPSTDCASPSFTSSSTVWGNITQNVSPDVDAIVSGHTHLAYNCSFEVEEWVTEDRAVTERPVVSSGQYGQNLNQLVFSIDRATGDVVAKTQEIVALTEADFTEDPDTVDIVHDALAESEVLGAEVLGQIEAPLNRARVSGGGENRGGESTLSNLTAEVQRQATQLPDQGIEADIAFMNPGGLRQDMAGTANGGVRDVTYKQAAVVQPFANTLVNLELTGAQIEEVLEEQWQRDSEGRLPTRPFLRLGVSEGFTYTYVETPTTVPPQPPATDPVETFEGEITGMWLNGEPIDPDATYSVTANSFLAGGGDNFRTFADGENRVDTGQVDLAAMVDFLGAHKAPDGDPLEIDYSQRAVEVHDVAGSYTLGGDLTFEVESWSMSTADDVKDTEIEVMLDGELIGTAALDNTVGATPYDNNGRASIDVPIPVSAGAGPATVTLVGPDTGTEVIVPIVIKKAKPTVKGKKVTQVKGKAAKMKVTVTAPGVTPTGKVTIKFKKKVLGKGTLNANGVVTVKLAKNKLKVRKKAYKVVIRYLGSPTVAKGQATAKVKVVKKKK